MKIENENNIESQDQEEKFELKTKTGSVWGSIENKEKIKASYTKKEITKSKRKERIITNFLLALAMLIIIILFIILQKEYDLWFI